MSCVWYILYESSLTYKWHLIMNIIYISYDITKASILVFYFYYDNSEPDPRIKSYNSLTLQLNWASTPFTTMNRTARTRNIGRTDAKKITSVESDIYKEDLVRPV